MSRSVIFSIFCTLMIAVAIGYLAITRARSEPAVTVRGSDGNVPETPASLHGQTGFVFVSAAFDETNSRLRLAPSGLTDTGRSVGELRCERVHVAADAGICLVAERGMFTTYRAHTFGPDVRPRHTIPLAGAPSRVRLSPDGRRAAMTVFVSGDSYNAIGFSTHTTLVDMNTGAVIGDLEAFTVWRAGKRFKAVDFNFWGVTFARDGNRFFATLGTAGKIYLIEGDVDAKSARVIATGIECPSLSPDNSRIVFKKRVPSGPWRLHLLDLATMRETPLGETRSVDDQVEWLDDETVMYGLPAAEDAPRTGGSDIWAVSVLTQAPPRMLVHHGYSPAMIR